MPLEAPNTAEDTRERSFSATPESTPASPKHDRSPPLARVLLGLCLGLCLFSLVVFAPSSDGISASFVTGACGIAGLWHSRLKLSGWCAYLSICLMVTALVLGCFPQGAHGIDIQEPGRPTSLLYTPRISPFTSSNVSDLLEQRTYVLNMVTQGDSSVFETKWCIDGGANRHVHSVPSDFKNFKSVPVTVHVAKKGFQLLCLNYLIYINTRNDLHDEHCGPLTRSKNTWCGVSNWAIVRWMSCTKYVSVWLVWRTLLMLTFPTITFRLMCSLGSSKMLGNRCLLGMFLTGAWPLLAEIQPLADLPRLTPSMATTMLPSSFAVTACIIGHMDITRRANAGTL